VTVTYRDLEQLERRIKAELEAERQRRLNDWMFYSTLLIAMVGWAIVLFVSR